MVGMAGENCDRSIKLLAGHDPHELVRPGHRPKADDPTRLRTHRGRKPIRASGRRARDWSISRRSTPATPTLRALSVRRLRYRWNNSRSGPAFSRPTQTSAIRTDSPAPCSTLLHFARPVGAPHLFKIVE